MEAGTALRFAMVARKLGAAAREGGLRSPAFRSPPGRPGMVRSIRRHKDGAVVAVQMHHRPFDRVAADMVEGVVAANDLQGAAAHRVRLALWEAIAGAVLDGGPYWPEARVAERQTQAA